MPARAAVSPMRWRKWFALNATVAVAAARIMGVEILSTRLAARYLGVSLYTWTSAIGVVLAGIAIGNYVGDRLANPSTGSGTSPVCTPPGVTRTWKWLLAN